MYSVLQHEYKTLKSLKEECRRRLSEYRDGVGTLCADDTEWFLALAKKYHHSKHILFCKPVDGIELYERLGQKNKHLRLIYRDGTTAAFSWNKCCRLVQRNTRAEVSGALRMAVVDQVMDAIDRAFDSRLLVVCPMTHKVICREQSHVDHAPPAFADLVQMWLRTERIAFSDVEIADYVHGGKVMANESQRASWALFHRKHAILRVVCREWNMKAGRHILDGDTNGRKASENS
jgi:ADP-ribosylglycohydrolase